MSVAGFGLSQQPLQINLAGRVIQEIGAANDVRDALRGIIHGHREHVGVDPIAALQDKITDRFRDILSIRALDPVGELHLFGIDSHADGCRRLLPQLAGTASAGITQLILERRVQLRAAAGAGEGALLCAQGTQGFFITLGVRVLAGDCAVPFEAKLLQGAQNSVRRPGDLAGTIEILDPQQPPPAMRARIQKAGDRRVKGS